MGRFVRRLNFVKLSAIIVLYVCCASDAYSATPVINEVMSSNNLTIKDEDRDNSDWIELHNPGHESIDLNDYTLSDDPDDPAKWTFPQISIAPQGHLLVFASGKDRATYPAHWETVVDKGDIWQYFLGTKEPPDNWTDRDFNDSSWLSGASKLGYGFDTITTFVPEILTMFIRKSFSVDDLSHISDGFLHIDYNDGFVAYLNGVEIARSNVAGSIGERPPFNQQAIHTKSPLIALGQPPEGYRLDDIKSLLVKGENVLAIQVHNNKAYTENFLIDPYLTLGMETVPANPGGVAHELEFTPPCLHSNFKLDASGETLTLSNPSGLVCDQFLFDVMPLDHSQGRYPDGSQHIILSSTPTPGTANSEGFTEFAGATNVEPVSGFFTDSVTVTMSTDSPDSEIRYTLNTYDPDASSTLYSGPITFSRTRILKARVFKKNMMPGAITTRTFFVNVEHSLPVFSISTPDKNLWDSEIGIYQSPNYWNEWERPAHVEFFETDGSMQFSEDAGIAIKGGLGSRYWPQKSLAVMFRNSYGVEKVKCCLFPGSDIDEYCSFVLRNGGNDFDRTHFRDGLIQTLVKDVDIDQQNFRPAVVYLNGAYWGIQGIREKQNEDCLASHHDVDPDNLDMLEKNAKIIEGDAESYTSLYDFIESNDLSIAENYEHVARQIDIDEFISYNAIQIYSDNQDWPGNNLKYWREKKDGGRWRWLLYDTDFGFGLKSSTAYSNNTLAHATAIDGVAWRNPAWSTLILRKLLENEGFKYKFINRFMDYLSTIFSSETVLSVIADIEKQFETEMPAHIELWGYPESMEKWTENVEVLKIFAQERPEYLMSHFAEKFDTGSRAHFSLDVSDTAMGSIRINSLTPDEYPWSGTYFTKVPVTVTPIPKAGHRFVRWEGTIEDDSFVVLSVSGKKNVSLKAVFEEGDASNSGVVINEINYQSQKDFNAGDWVELFNNSSETIDLGNWILKDSQDDNIFTVQEGIRLLPKDFLILCADSLKFRQMYPSISNIQGNFDFGLNKNGDAVRIFDQFGVLIDSLTYDNRVPWPELNDEDARTISLSNPMRDNTQGIYWKASKLKGTPGQINDNYITIDEDTGEEISAFVLRQNFPNPFNQATTISFEIPRDSHVTIELYSILGQKIRTITKGKYSGGKHMLTIDGSNLSSGIYFYKMSAGGFSHTKRLLRLK